MNAVHTVTLNQATIKGLKISWKSQLLEHYERSLVWHKVRQQGSTALSLNLHLVPFSYSAATLFSDRLLCLCVMLQPFAKINILPSIHTQYPRMTPWERIFRTLALVTASSPGHEATSLHNRIWEYSDVLHCRRSQTLHSLTGAVGGRVRVNQGLSQSCPWETLSLHRLEVQVSPGSGSVGSVTGFHEVLRFVQLSPWSPCSQLPHGTRLPPRRCTGGAEQVMEKHRRDDQEKRPEIKCEGLFKISCCNELVNN